MRRKPKRPKPIRRPRLALALRRRPRLRSALVVAVGLLSGAAVMVTVRQADHTRTAWGRTTTVLVATRDLAAGDQIDDANTRLIGHPAPLVPPGALTARPEDERVSEAVYEGEVLRAERVAPSGSSPVAARLPASTRAMAIPLDTGTAPPLEVGDHVDVMVALAPEAAGGGPPGFALATDVVVVGITETAATVAMPRDLAPRLAVALGQGAVTLALVSAAQRTA